MPATPGAPPNPQAVADASAGSTEPQLTFSLVIKKTAGMSLGIDVAYSSAAAWTRNGVFIARVFEDGIVAAWNARSQEPRRVQPGDFIFQVNNIHGDTVSMIQEMKVKQQLTIHILRRSSAMAGVPMEEIRGDGPPEGAQLHNGPLPPRDGSEASSAEGRDVDADGNDDPSRTVPATVEALLPQLIALGDEALAGLVCVALERRPWLRDSVLSLPEPEPAGDDAGAGQPQNEEDNAEEEGNAASASAD